MYRDLDPAAWPEGQTPGEHPLMQALLNPSPDTEQCPGFREDEVDEKLATRDVHHVLDADSSQIAVIEDVKRGRNLAVVFFSSRRRHTRCSRDWSSDVCSSD